MTTPADLDRIQAAFPDLAIRATREITEGLVNRVIIVNGERVFRFPRNDWARTMQERELRVLDLLTPRLVLRIPRVDFRSPEMISYPIVPGVPLTRNRYLTLDPVSQDRMAQSLASFLHQMHTTPLPGDLHTSDGQRTQEQHLATYEDVKRELAPLLMADQVEWVHELYAPLIEDPGFLTAEPVLINADLACYHLLCDPTEGALTGVIDFGTAGTGDPASDFGTLISMYGESLVRRLSAYYEGIPGLIERARFYTGQVELFWMLRGLRSTDRSWFAAHLGRARDALPIGSGWPKGGD